MKSNISYVYVQVQTHKRPKHVVEPLSRVCTWLYLIRVYLSEYMVTCLTTRHVDNFKFSFAEQVQIHFFYNNLNNQLDATITVY